jgi:large repetitive protein
VRRTLALLALVAAGLLLTPGAIGVPTVPDDPTPPAVTPVMLGQLGLEGWYVTNLTVNWRIEDPESVILRTEGCDARTLNADTVGTRLTCTAESDGGETTVAKTFKVDKTAPSAFANPSRPVDSNGWFNHALTVNFSGGDGTSGLASCSDPQTYQGPDSSSATVSGSCRDVAGNTTPVSLPLKYDATAPQNNGASASRAPDAQGWYNHTLTVAFGGADGTSGVDACTEVQYSGPDDPSRTVTGTCRDRAGNQSGTKTFALKYDETAPTVTGRSPSRQPDSNGWYNHALAVTFAGSDDASGIDTCTQTTYGGPDSGAASVPGTCRDRAGNVSATDAFALKFDATAPQVTPSADRAANAKGWYRAPVTVSFAGGDAVSGVDTCSAPKTYSGPDSGSTSVGGSCTDKAGNGGSGALGLKYDATAPQVNATPSRAADANGWYNHALTVSFAGTDATSGPPSCDAPKGYGAPDSGNASVTGSCTDDAGNTGSRSFGFKYDQTAPQSSASPSRAADSNGWYNRELSVVFSGSDVTSGVASCDAPKTYNGPDSGNALVNGKCVDQAGNNGPASLSVKFDATAPQVTPSADRGANAKGWYRAPVTVSFAGSDALSGVDLCSAPKTYGGPDSGSASVGGSCTDKAGNGGSGALGLKYDATAPQVTASPSRQADANGWYNHALTVGFAGTDATSGPPSCDAPKSYGAPDSENASVTGSCTDDAGNTGSRSHVFKYDATRPQASSSPSRPADVNGWYNDELTVTFGGSDATSGVASCDPPKTYAGPDSANAVVDGKCVDRAGNTSLLASLALKFDATAPQVTPSADRAANANGWYRAPVTVSFAGSDALSGVDACSLPKTYSGPDSGGASVGGSCSDKAGNGGSGALGLKYDATAPQVTASPSRAADANGWFNRALSVSFVGADATSLIASCDAPKPYSGPDDADITVSGSCSDTAGNAASDSFAFRFDGTAPRVTQVTPVRGPDQAPWYNHPVAFAVQGEDATAGIAACPAAVYDGPDRADAAVAGACLDQAGNRGVLSIPISYDGTGPQVNVEPTRGPDANGWYNHPVDVSFSGSDLVAGLASCASPGSYNGPDTGFGVVSGTCVDQAGNVGVREFALQYDATPPQVTGVQPERAPDANGWYSRPVNVDFVGTDTVSQIESCTRASYAGPDSSEVSLSGSCWDRAGNPSGLGTFGLKYDGTAPGVSGLTAKAGDRSVALTWAASADTTRVEIARSPAAGGSKVTVYRGNGRSFSDQGLENNVRYRYDLAAYDEADNKAAAAAEALPRAPLYGPVAGARVSSPPLLAWAPVAGASYYNVQVWTKRRVFSAWPAGRSLRLKRAWTYAGRRYHLAPGRYRWYVWPGYGRRADKRYGRLLGSSTFVVVARRSTR